MSPPRKNQPIDPRDTFIPGYDEIPVIAAGERIKQFVDLPLWTSSKATLISNYLRSFVFVTRHGTYIDCFAGPQALNHRGSTWAAKLVLESEPKYLRKFYLFEMDQRKLPFLEELKVEHGQSWARSKNRKVEIRGGDCNVEVPKFLGIHRVRDKEATFALLDQRTFECRWELVRYLANHKKKGNKIELFYFLAQGWIDRAMSKLRGSNEEKLNQWWGGSGWKEFARLKKHERCERFASRFTEELGYKSALSFPIRKQSDSGRVMFWMIHATDHALAPHLMVDAYNDTVLRKGRKSGEEMELFINQMKAKNPHLF